MMKLGILPKLLQNLFSKPMTVRFPHESIPIPDGYRGEHTYDVDKCISCGLCAKICPNRAIEMIETSKEHREVYPKTYPKIDLGKCCFCGLCEDICPKDAIRLTKNFFLSTSDPYNIIKYPTPKKSNKSWEATELKNLALGGSKMVELRKEGKYGRSSKN